MKGRLNTTSILTVLIIVSLAANVFLFVLYFGGQPDEPSFQSPKYTLYIGTNDQDTNEPVMSMDEAIASTNEICLRYTDSFTAVEAKGVWKNAEDIVFQEETLIYVFYDIEEAKVKAIMDEVMEALNQNTILLETSEGVHTFYSGSPADR